MSELSGPQQLRKMAGEIRNLAKITSFTSGDVARQAGNLLVQCFDLGAFSGVEHGEFRAYVRKHRLQGSYEHSDRWLTSIFVEAMWFLAGLKVGEGNWKSTCSPIADAIEAEALKLERQVTRKKGGGRNRKPQKRNQRVQVGPR